MAAVPPQDVAVLPHAPPWVAGLALRGQRAWGVLDLGRLLGVARVTAGTWLQPHEGWGYPWLIQVHEARPVWGAVSIEPSPAATAGGVEGLAARSRPGFSFESASWVDPEGQPWRADVLDLPALLQHPRVREFQS